MGTYTDTILEVRACGRWLRAMPHNVDRDDDNFPLAWQDRDLRSFLSPLFNGESLCPCLSETSRGLPLDSDYLNEEIEDGIYPTRRRDAMTSNGYDFGFTWYTLAELLAFDYERSPGIEVQRRTIGGPFYTMRDFLGENYFDHLARMGVYGAPEDVRILVWFK